mmetsp:Transcript_9788/g.28751  ORF Transcript_9788/g.28751 Transcript_9788/m.28751 type:complete len:278 (-) Transcript_9788:633-1466(-)
MQARGQREPHAQGRGRGDAAGSGVHHHGCAARRVRRHEAHRARRLVHAQHVRVRRVHAARVGGSHHRRPRRRTVVVLHHRNLCRHGAACQRRGVHNLNHVRVRVCAHRHHALHDQLAGREGAIAVVQNAAVRRRWPTHVLDGALVDHGLHLDGQHAGVRDASRSSGKHAHRHRQELHVLAGHVRVRRPARHVKHTQAQDAARRVQGGGGRRVKGPASRAHVRHHGRVVVQQQREGLEREALQARVRAHDHVEGVARETWRRRQLRYHARTRESGVHG